MKIIERIFDATTGQTIDVEKTLSSDELAERQTEIERLEQIAIKQAEAQAAKEAAQAKLAALGLTTEDLKALGL